MKSQTAKQITYWLGVIIIGLAIGLTVQFVRAWTEPTVAPTGGNVGAPINTSGIQQGKSGSLGLNSNGNAIGLIVQGNVGIGTASPAQKLQVIGGKAQADDFCLNSPTTTCLSNTISGIGLGNWSTPDDFYKIGTLYQAPTDGFVVARHVAGNQSENCLYVFRTDSTTSPIIRGAMGNGNDGTSQTMMVPVRKNDYWKIGLNSGGNCGIQSIYFVPFGSQ